VASPLLGHDALPVEVILDGRAFPISHDFRAGIRFETMMTDARITEAEKVVLAIRIFFGETPDVDLGDVIDAILDFFRCGKPVTDFGESDDRPLYSYSHDYDLIFAGFLNAYGIDLLDPATELHWFKFRAMLAALPESSQFMRVIGYRALDLTSSMSPEERSHYAKLKRLYALPDDAAMRPVTIRDEDSYRSVIEAVLAAKRAALDGEL
jgi:hypothetical protein